MLLTEYDKRIYNTYLASGRIAKNQPFKLRKNFDGIGDEKYILLKKLGDFFARNNHINMQDYFSAPYDIYGKDAFLELNFFLSRKAINCYTLKEKKKALSDPESDQVKESVKASCKFLYSYCKSENITLDEYKTYTPGAVPIYLTHLKERRINFYIVHGLEIADPSYHLGNDLLDFMISEYKIYMDETRLNFMKSKKLKVLVKTALNIVNEKLRSDKQQTSKKQTEQ